MGWRVIEPPGHPHLQGSFQTTNIKEALTDTFLLDTHKRDPKKDKTPANSWPNFIHEYSKYTCADESVGCFKAV
jgi:hypothetical protein